MPKAIRPDFKSLFESAPGLNLALLPDLTIVAVSDAYLKATMTKRLDIIGHHLYEIFPDNPDNSSATGVSNLRFSLNYVLHHKASHTMAIQKYDIRKPDGTCEQRYWSPINKPVLDSSNEVVYIIHRVKDVTEFILAKKDQAEKEEIQQINQQLLSEIEERRKAEDKLIEMNRELDKKVLKRTDEILKSKNIISETFERITDAFVGLDNNWCYTYMNKKAGEIFNRVPKTMIGKNIWAEFPEGINQSFYKAYYKALETQQYIYLEEYYAPYNLWFENHIYPSPDGLSIFFRDITEKKNAEESLKEKNNFIESIINASPDIIYIYDIEERKNIYANEGIQTTLGYSDDEIKQMGNQVVPILMHPKDFDYYLLNTYPKYANAEDKECITHQYRLRDKKGNWHWVNCKESIFLRKPDGTPKQIFGVTSDITESKKAEEDLRVAHQWLTRHLHNTPLAIIEWDKNFIIRKWSAQAENIFGWKETEVANKHFNDLSLVLKEDAEAVGIIGEQLMSGEVNHNSIINRNNTKAGNIIYCQWFNSVLKDEEGRVNSILSLILDVTESKKTNLILAGEKTVMEMIATEKQLEEVLKTVALNYESYSDIALCSILLLDDKGTHIKHGAAPSLADAFNKGIDGEPIGPVAGSCGTAAYRKERVIVSDIATDPLWVNYRDFALGFGLKASWSTPIINTEGKVYGTFAIYYRECRTPTEADLALIDRAANQVKIILERYYKDTKIKESEEKYRTLVEQASDAIFIADANGRFISVNTSACKLSEYSEEELLKMSIYDFAILENIQREPFHFDELKQGKTVNTERLMKRKNSTPFYIEINAKLLSDGRLLTFVRDITERKKAEEKILQLNLDLELRVKERTTELEKINIELEEINDLFVGREARMIELKEELEALKNKPRL